MFNRMKLLIGLVAAMRPALRRAYGLTWPFALVRCALHKQEIVRRTRWAGRKDAEARYVGTLALLPTIGIDLQRRLGERAWEVMRELTTAVVEAENARAARETGLLQIPDLCERWHAYFDRSIIHGVGAFNETECLAIQPDRFHYRVFRCVFAELARDAGVPELGRIVCDLDIPFHRRHFPAYEFHRGGSSRNTLAYGHACCEYVWERRAAVSVENSEHGDKSHRAGVAGSGTTPEAEEEALAKASGWKG
jgi:hypothetical protein